MNWADLLKQYGIATLFAVALLGFVLYGVAGALKEHDAGTRQLLGAICSHTAILAKRNPAECWGVYLREPR